MDSVSTGCSQDRGRRVFFARRSLSSASSGAISSGSPWAEAAGLRLRLAPLRGLPRSGASLNRSPAASAQGLPEEIAPLDADERDRRAKNTRRPLSCEHPVETESIYAVT